jgi:hypothetical protein
MDEDKTRPAVVKSLSDRSVVLRPVSSALSRYRFPARHTELTDPDVAGLHRPTGVQRREVTVDLIELLQIVGALSERDMSAVFFDQARKSKYLGKITGTLERRGLGLGLSFRPERELPELVKLRERIR